MPNLMEKIWSSNISKLKSAFAILLLISSNAFAQTWTLQSEVRLEGLDKMSFDRRGQLYLSDQKGNIYQYSPLGLEKLNYSPPRQGKLSILEAWNTQRIFAFYQEFQNYRLFDRFLVPTPDQRMSIPPAGFINVATLSADQQIWLVDDRDFSLKKYNPKTNEFSIITPLNLMADLENYQFTFLREYQNRLFLVDKNSGILIFDNLGNYEQTIEAGGIDWIAFEKDEIQYLTANTLTLQNLYSLEKRSLILPTKATQAVIFNDKGYLIEGNSLRIYLIN